MNGLCAPHLAGQEFDCYPRTISNGVTDLKVFQVAYNLTRKMNDFLQIPLAKYSKNVVLAIHL